MSENRNSELESFARELRRLEPVCGNYRIPETPRHRKHKLVLAAVSAVAVLAASMLIAFVGLQSPDVEEFSPPPFVYVEPALPVVTDPPVIKRERLPGTTMREHLACLLAEYEVENPIPPTHKPEYPVVEIVVSDRSHSPFPERPVLQGRMRLRDLDFDPM